MTSEKNNKRHSNNQTLYQAAIAVAVAAGLFSLLILGILGLRYFRHTYVLPLQENRLEEIKNRLSSAPEDEVLLEEARELDRSARVIRFQWYEFASRAGFLLFFNLTVMLAGFKIALKLKEPPPNPGPQNNYEEQNAHLTAMSRRAVGTGFVLFIVVALAVANLSPELEYHPAAEPEEHAEERDLPGPPDKTEILANWPRFRGPGGGGVSKSEKIPEAWDIETGENILWKAEVPLPGQSSPIVWEDKVFLTGATETRRQVYCYDGKAGELVWAGDVPEMDVSASEIELNPDTGYAAPTAYTDGRRVYAFFPTGDVTAFDYEGNRQWLVNLGEPDNIYGHATSLVGYEDMVIVQYDNGQADDDHSRIVALDWESGDIVWETPRAVTASWTTPVIIETEYGDQLITASEPYLIAYDLEKGSELWRGEVMRGEIAPSPIHDSGLIMAISPYVEMIALEPPESGTIDEESLKWSIDRGVPDIVSPISDGKRVYLLETYGGTIRVHSLEDGDQIWDEYLGADFYASPLLVNDKIYLFCSEGVGYIFKAGSEFEMVAENPLGERVQASPAVVKDRMYIRGEEHLFCIGWNE